MEKDTVKNQKIKAVKNYLLPMTVFGGIFFGAFIASSVLLFIRGIIGYAFLCVMMGLIIAFITFLTGRRSKDLNDILSLPEDRLSVWYLSKKAAVASSALELKKMSNDDILTSLVLFFFMMLLGGVFGFISKSIAMFITMLAFGAVIVIVCVSLHGIRRSRIASSRGICIFGEYGVYANGVYHSFCDIGISDISSKYNEKNRLLIISYKNKLLSPGRRMYIPIFVPEGFEEEAIKINKFYASYDD